MGVYVEYCWVRLGSPDPYASGDSISLVARCFSSSNGCGLVRLLLPDEDSDPCSAVSLREPAAKALLVVVFDRVAEGPNWVVRVQVVL